MLLVVVETRRTRFLFFGFDMFFGLGLCGHLSREYIVVVIIIIIIIVVVVLVTFKTAI